MMNAWQMCEVMNKRYDIVKAYCKKKKWDKDNLTVDQVLEIRSTYKWRHVTTEVMKGY